MSPNTHAEGATEPRLIKRYANRKMYDTERSCYVTLEEVAELVRGGVDVRVIDNTTKEDLTEVTLTQALLDSRRKNRQSVSLAGLRTLISHSGDNLGRNLADSVARARTDVERTVEKWRNEAERTVGRVLQRKEGEEGEPLPEAPRDAMEAGIGLDERLRRLVDSLGAATRRHDDRHAGTQERIAALEARVAELEAQLAGLAKPTPPARRKRSESGSKAGR